MKKRISVLLAILVVVLLFCTPCFAADSCADGCGEAHPDGEPCFNDSVKHEEYGSGEDWQDFRGGTVIYETLSVNGVSIPATMPMYLDGVPTGSRYYQNYSKFSKNGSACTCHGKSYCDYQNPACNCQRYVTSGRIYKQCWGFAMAAHMAVWGAHATPGQEINISKLTTVPQDGGGYTEAVWREILAYIPLGSHIRLQFNNHSVFLVEKSANRVVVYQGNVKGYCNVVLTSYTYFQFAEWAKVFSWYSRGNTAIHDHAYPEWDYDDATHWRDCGFLGCTVGSNLVHLMRYFDNNSTCHTAACRICGFEGEEAHYLYLDANGNCSRCGRLGSDIVIPWH